MTALTTTQISNLDRMNRPSTSAQIGTRIAALEAGAVVSGSHTVTDAEASASSVTIQTSVASITGRTVQVTKSGSNISNIFISTSGSNLTMTSASAAYTIDANDVINYIVW